MLPFVLLAIAFVPMVFEATTIEASRPGAPGGGRSRAAR